MPSLKPSLPFGQLPVLEIDGVTIGQSMAIARFLANEYGISGSSNLVKAKVDEVVDVMNDVQDAMVRRSQNWEKMIRIIKNILYIIAVWNILWKGWEGQGRENKES